MSSSTRRESRTESRVDSSSSSTDHQQQVNLIEIHGQGSVLSVAFLVDGKHIVSGDSEGKLRRWRVEDGVEVGTPVDAGGKVWNIAVSRDGKWVVSGTRSGWVKVWNAENHNKVAEFKGHSSWTRAVDVSPDGTRIATGSDDSTLCFWSLSTGSRLLGPLKHDCSWVVAVKFSPDGRLAAAATWEPNSVWIYDSQDGRLLVDVPIQVASSQSLAWNSDNKQLYVLSRDGNINCLDVSTGGTTLSQWPIHSNNEPTCIALARNGTFIAASANSSVSFWDITTHKQIGSVIEHTTFVESMAISTNYDLVIAGDATITLRSLCDTLPSPYSDYIFAERARRRMEVEKADLEETIQSLRAREELSNSRIACLEGTVQQLCNQLSDSQRGADSLNKIIKALCAQEEGLNRKNARLEETVQQLHNRLSDSQRAAAQEKDNLNETINALRAQDMNSNRKFVRLEEIDQQLHHQLSISQQRVESANETIESLHTKTAHFEKTIQELRTQYADSQHTADSLVQTLRAHEQKHQCEILYAEGCIIDAALSFLQIINTVSVEVRTNTLLMGWAAKFKSQCISTLEIIGDEASDTEKQDEAVAAYSAALLLRPSTPNTILIKWASTALIRSSANEALTAATKFNLPESLTYRAICSVLQEDGRVSEAIECFRQMQRELGEGTDHRDRQAQSELGEGIQRRHSDATDSFRSTANIPEKEMNPIDETEWVANFKARCLKTLEQRGDVAMDSASYKDADIHYTTALTLNPSSTDLLTKRSKARAYIGLWQDSLEDADAAIKLDPSSPHGYEGKRAALLGAHQYDEAINAYNNMLLKLEESPDPVTRELRNHYVSPSQTISVIRSSVKRTQRDAPLALINMETGRLYDKQERLEAFEADPKFKELVASITIRRDHSRITQAVQEYFRYATFSHTWEGAEPLFHDILYKPVSKLAASPTVSKLVMFCMTVREAGLRWAWSDTCCINKADSSVLQESLTSMFQWYHESALTIVHLKGVRSDSELHALVRCFWNTRAWTLQEFFASRVIRFYTEDWKPYLPHESMYNHKDSSVIMGEMAAANGVDIQVLLSLRPGSENVRQKLCLAAMRMATKQEDIAYSLFGIFDVSIPVTYGEGQRRALGRLLQEVLTRSGDATILAWTGEASDYNSCLPAEIGVYREPASPYIPSLIDNDKMDALVTKLRTSSGYLDSAIMLYDRLVHLQSPRLFSRRLSLSCITFPLRGLLISNVNSQLVYRATTSALGNVEIKTTEDLSGLRNLILVHPWLQCLLDPALPSEDVMLDDHTEPLSPVDGDGGDGDSGALSPFSPHTVPPSYDKFTRALRLFVRLRQPFGALLLVPLSHNEYKRVASDNPIVVQLLENVSPRYLIQKIRTLDIL